MLKLWGRVNSVNVKKVLWMLDELGIAYDRADAGLEHGVVNEPDYRAMNPNGRVPTIEDDGFRPVGIEFDPAVSRDEARRARCIRPTLRARERGSMDGLAASTLWAPPSATCSGAWCAPRPTSATCAR